MNDDEKKKLTERMIARVSTGFAFINDKYLVQQYNVSGPDIAWLRSVYILFSFYFELLLKSAFVLSRSFSSMSECDDQLKKLGHNIKVIWEELKNANFKNIGIENISLKNGEYIIKTSDKTIYVKDFNDIRYDFIGGKIRNVSANEDAIIKESLGGAYEIFKEIKNIWKVM